VIWPSTSAVALAALSLEDKMVELLLAEVDRMANSPIPPAERKRRMVELRRQINELQRQGLALGHKRE
jgi:hypothetical protein